MGQADQRDMEVIHGDVEDEVEMPYPEVQADDGPVPYVKQYSGEIVVAVLLQPAQPWLVAAGRRRVRNTDLD